MALAVALWLAAAHAENFDVLESSRVAAREAASGLRSRNPADPTGANSSVAARAPLQRFDRDGRDVTLIELPADRLPNGTAARSHHALGFRSTAAEHWLNGQGIEATHCYLPMLRLHTKLDMSGEFRGALWIYARCALR